MTNMQMARCLFFADLPNGEFSKRLCVQGIKPNMICVLPAFKFPTFFLSEYNNFLTLLPCSRDNANQIFKVRLATPHQSSPSSSSSSFTSSLRSFQLLLPSGRCLRPHERRAAPLESPGLRGIFGLDGCPALPGKTRTCSLESGKGKFFSDSTNGVWTWRKEGALRWEGKVPWLEGDVVTKVIKNTRSIK